MNFALTAMLANMQEFQDEQPLLDKPSMQGDFVNCRHGGPPSDERVMMYLAAMSHIIEQTTTALMAHEVREKGGESMPYGAGTLEVHLFCHFWGKPEFLHTIIADSCKISFSCAVDAVADANFAAARLLVRLGIFVGQIHKYGFEQWFADVTAQGAQEDTNHSARMEEYVKCLHKTRTDRGLCLYLARRLSCNCLSAYKATAKATLKTGICNTCGQQLPLSKLRKCSACKAVEYCSKDCQRADWSGHKTDCKKIQAYKEKNKV
jgi:hypothetical protein